MNKLKEIIRETYYKSMKRIDFLSLFLGLLIGNLAWAVQPKWFQGRYLIEHGDFATAFIMMSYIFLLVIVGIIFYRLIKIALKKKRDKK